CLVVVLSLVMGIILGLVAGYFGGLVDNIIMRVVDIMLALPSLPNVWIEYNRIKEMNLSEDGELVMQLEQRRLLIRVRNIDDLEK
ncbi:DUF986 family protein, partial [Salmonella enterica subsp. enterica serovar Virginia]|nr:DUF986 family protein [Salmonella enterica subsp. enterica serovar Virginia]